MQASRNYVTVGVNEDVFAIDVAYVREILDDRDVSGLPHAPPYLIGVIDVRGLTVPVVDLRIRLGLQPIPPTENTRILVLEITLGGRDLVIGLRTDRVFEVAEFALNGLDAAPDIGLRWNSDYIQAIGRLHGGFVILFDMERLFSTDEAVTLQRTA